MGRCQRFRRIEKIEAEPPDLALIWLNPSRFMKKYSIILIIYMGKWPESSKSMRYLTNR